MKINVPENAISSEKYLLSTCYPLDEDMFPDGSLTVTIKFKQSNKNMLIFFGKKSNEIINEFQTISTSFTSKKSEIGDYFWFDIISFGIIEIEYIKIELGNRATTFTSKTYTEELNNCKRFYQTGKFSFAFALGDNTLKGSTINLFIPMRCNPTDLAGNNNKITMINQSGNNVNLQDYHYASVEDNSKFKVSESYSSDYVGFAFLYKLDSEIY